MSLSPGSRPHRVTLQNPGEPVPDGEGGYTEEWTDLNPPQVYASIEPASQGSLESLTSGAIIATASHIVGIPYHAQVTMKTRIVLEGPVAVPAERRRGPSRELLRELGEGGRIFSVTKRINPKEQNRELQLTCEEYLP